MVQLPKVRANLLAAVLRAVVWMTVVLRMVVVVQLPRLVEPLPLHPQVVDCPYSLPSGTVVVSFLLTRRRFRVRKLLVGGLLQREG